MGKSKKYPPICSDKALENIVNEYTKALASRNIQKYPVNAYRVILKGIGYLKNSNGKSCWYDLGSAKLGVNAILGDHNLIFAIHKAGYLQEAREGLEEEYKLTRNPVAVRLLLEKAGLLIYQQQGPAAIEPLAADKPKEESDNTTWTVIDNTMTHEEPDTLS